MKKLVLLSALLIALILNGFSQSQKNDLKVTVSALPLFGNSDGFGNAYNGIVLKPSLGFFISNQTSIDLNFTYASMDNIKVDFFDSYFTSYSFVPSIRNNFVNNEKLRLFAELGFGFGTIKYEADDEQFSTNLHEELSGGISVLNIGVGANYFFNEKFGLEIIIPYIHTKNISSNKSNIIFSGIGPTIGLTFKL